MERKHYQQIVEADAAVDLDRCDHSLVFYCPFCGGKSDDNDMELEKMIHEKDCVYIVAREKLIEKIEYQFENYAAEEYFKDETW